MRYRLRTLLIVLALFGVGLGLLRVVAKTVKPSYSCHVRASFTELPADDEPLREWTEDQPGVHRAFVNRRGDVIEVTWIMSRDLTGNPDWPDFQANFNRFGYRGMKQYHEP